MKFDFKKTLKRSLTAALILIAVTIPVIIASIVLPFIANEYGYSSLGDLLEEFFGIEQGDDKTEEAPPVEYQITSFAVDRATGGISATVQVYGNCKLVVRLVEENAFFSSASPSADRYVDGYYAEQSFAIPKTDPVTEFIKEDVTLSFQSALPPEFVAEAVIINEAGEALSSFATDITHSRRYGEFLAVTPDDFEKDDSVLSFDSGAYDSFGVLADGVKVITAEELLAVEGKENENGFIDTYTLKRPSENVTVGDRIYATDGTDSILIKVCEITASGDLITVKAENADDGGFSLKDFYKFLRADMELYDPSADHVTLASKTEGEEEGESESFSKVYSLGNIPFTLESENDIKISGWFKDMTISLKAHYVWAPSVFGDDYFECELTGVAKTDVDVDIKAGIGSESTGVEDSFNLKNVKRFAKIPIPTPIVGLTLKAEISNLFSYSLAATVGVNDIPVTAYMGYHYNTVGGFRSLGSGVHTGISKSDNWLELSGEISLVFGPVVAIGVDFIAGLFTVEIGGAYGIALNAYCNRIAGSGLEHTCDFCVDGHIDFLYNVNVTAKMQLLPDFKLILKEVELVDEDVLDVYTFYISKESESPLKIGEGICPNWYKSIELSGWCDAYEYFICDMDYSNDYGDYRYQKEDRDGKHKHHPREAKILISNAITGEVYYNNVLYTTYGNENQKLADINYQTDIFFIPRSVRELRFTVDFICDAEECALYSGNDAYYGYDLSYPEREIRHTFEGILINESLYCRECNTFVRGSEHEKFIFKGDTPEEFWTINIDDNDWGDHCLWCSKYVDPNK